jgi:hypothetical protein
MLVTSFRYSDLETQRVKGLGWMYKVIDHCIKGKIENKCVDKTTH